MTSPELSFLEKLTGSRWTGIRFCDSCGAAPRQCSTLCQAIARSFTGRFCLEAQSLACPGALRCLGFAQHDADLAAHMSRESGADPACIRAIMAGTARMQHPAQAVELGAMADPAFCVSYISPEAGMKLLRQWQMLSGRSLAADLSSFMAICSAVVAAGERDSLVFSLGCPESRNKGSVTPDRLVAVVPRGVVKSIMQGLRACRHMEKDARPAGFGRERPSGLTAAGGFCDDEKTAGRL